MGFISEIVRISRSSESKPRGIGEVEAALARLREERSTAKEAVTAAMRSREDELLVDGSDKRIAALDAAADRHRLTLERCDKLEPMLLEELAGRRDEAKRRAWQAMRERYDVSARGFAVSFGETLSKWEALVALRGQAQTAGFASEAGALTVPPYTLTRELLDAFEAALDRQRDQAGLGAWGVHGPRRNAWRPATAPHAQRTTSSTSIGFVETMRIAPAVAACF
jgi:hypothetical protein